MATCWTLCIWAGIRFVLVRNDLDPERSGSERPAVIRAALAGSPGLTEVARFGPAQPPAFRPGDHRAGAAAPDPAAVEVFAVAGAERVTTYPDDGAVALSGGRGRPPPWLTLSVRRPRWDVDARRRRRRR